MLDSEVWGIIAVTLRMSVASTSISAVLGTVLGLLLERSHFPGKWLVVRINRTLMGTPPVVVGLVVYLALMRKGPLGSLNILFTVRAMVIAQVLIITPIICGMVYTSAQRNAKHIRAFGATMGATPIQTQILLIRELSHEIYFAVITGFGRSISEVGAVMIVGGNIQYRTRTMTTAITLLRNKGSYTDAIFLGAVLLLIAFLIQTLADRIRKKERHADENI
ncbi:MAG: ABC transporter permease [Clostridiales bacterium]|nr:ABC transporter permease [Clostridiales bacterium]